MRNHFGVVVCVSLAIGIAGRAHADRLVDVSEVKRGDFSAPRFAPGDRDLLVTGPKLAGLYLIAGDGSSVRTLTDEAAAGVGARWNADGTVRYRAVRAGTRRDLILDRTGQVRTATYTLPPIAVEQNERIYVRDGGGQLVAVGSGDRFFAPEVSPDGDRVAFQGLTTGIYIYVRSTGDLIHVGAGTAPSWSPDGTRLVFELTEDDGHELTASDIYMYELAGRRMQRLTTTSSLVERRPSFSSDGRRIVFDDNTGGIFVGRLEEVR
jgi:Tol biopolymer transport system component